LLINNELKDSNATKDKFLSIIAHDLRNPFQSILGLSSLLKGNIDSTSKDDQILYLTHIINSTKKCNDLLTGLLDWAMTKSGKMKTKPVSINVEELVKSAVDEVNSSLTIKKIDIQIDIHRDLNFLADRTMLSVVLRNLLSNAIKFSMQGSQIFVYTEKENNFFHILIKDKGIGIPPDLIDKIFDIGENTSRRGTDNEQGTGLGLMLAKEFVAKNSGYISVDSKVGNGSVFKLTFPIHSV